jgi:hypothetical protein
MPWVRLDEGFADHPKIERAGPMAAWLHVVAICYCNRHLTDGRIPKAKARRLADIPTPDKHIKALVDAGLWDDEGDDYIVHDFLDYQPSRADVEADRAQARDRMAKRRRKPDGTFGRSSPEHPPNKNRSSPEVRPPRSSSTPTRPVTEELKGGGNSRASPDDAPPLRCPTHTKHRGPVPPCGACADARRAYDIWANQNANGRTDPLADAQIAARKRAEQGTAKAHQIAAQPPDPDAAQRIAAIHAQHRLATKKDP